MIIKELRERRDQSPESDNVNDNLCRYYECQGTIYCLDKCVDEAAGFFRLMRTDKAAVVLVDGQEWWGIDFRWRDAEAVAFDYMERTSNAPYGCIMPSQGSNRGASAA